MLLHGASTALRSHASTQTLAASERTPTASAPCSGAMAWRLLHLASRLRLADQTAAAAPRRLTGHRRLPRRAATSSSSEGVPVDSTTEVVQSSFDESSSAAEGARADHSLSAQADEAATTPPPTQTMPTARPSAQLPGPPRRRPRPVLPLSSPIAGFSSAGSGISTVTLNNKSSSSHSGNTPQNNGSSAGGLRESSRPPVRRRAPLAATLNVIPPNSGSGSGSPSGVSSPQQPRSGSSSGRGTPRRPPWPRPPLPVTRSAQQQQGRATRDGTVGAAAVQATAPLQQQQQRAPWDDHPIDLVSKSGSDSGSDDIDSSNGLSSDITGRERGFSGNAPGAAVTPGTGPPRSKGPRALMLSTPRSGIPPPPAWALQAAEAAAAWRRQRQQQQQEAVASTRGSGGDQEGDYGLPQNAGRPGSDHWLDHWPVEHHPGGFWAQLMGVGLHLPPDAGGAGGDAPLMNLATPQTTAASMPQGAADSSSSSNGTNWPAALSALAPPAVDLSKLADASSFASAIVGDVQDLQDEPLRLLWLAAHQPGGAGAPALVFAWECGLEVALAPDLETSSTSADDDADVSVGDKAGEWQQEVVSDSQHTDEDSYKSNSYQSATGQQSIHQEQQQQQCRRWPVMPGRLGSGPDAIFYRVTPPAELPQQPQLRVEGLKFSTPVGGGGSGQGETETAPLDLLAQTSSDSLLATVAADSPGSNVAADTTAEASAAAAGGGSRNDGWHIYVFAVRGGFSLMGPHETTFPNVLADLSDGRVCHNARSLSDAAAFAAEPLEAAVRAHAANLARCALQRPRGEAVLPPEWCLSLLRARWGETTLRRFGVGLGTLLAMG